MVDKYKPLVVKPLTLAAPGRIVASAWCVLLALILVYGRDIERSAAAADHGALVALAPAAQAVGDVAEASGVAAGREMMEAPARAVYGSPLLLADSSYPGEVAQVCADPPRPHVQHIQVKMAAPAAQPCTQLQSALPVVKRILIVGASSIQESLGIELERRIEKYAGVTVMRVGRYSSGLARPDYFDWPQRLAELQAQFKPDLVMAQWGGNDCQGISTKDGKFVAKFGTDDWDSAYAKRVDEIVKQMQQNGCHAVMVGMPAMRDKSFNNKIKRLDGVTEKACSAAGGIYIATLPMTTDAKGKYLDQVEFEGKKRLMRAGDGIHFSDHGAAFVADQICQRLGLSFTLAAQ